MILVKCRPLGKVFPSNKEDEIGFMICRYEALDDSILPKGTNTNIFSAKGPLLPYSQSSVCVLTGSDWNMENGYLTLDCIGYEEEIPITTKSLSQFLSTIQGCSASAVKRIINYAGERQLLHVLDADHEIINKAITNKYVSDMICNGIELRLRKKEIYFYIASLLPPKANINIAVRAALQACSIEEIRTNPFHFVFESVIPYQIAKRIAKDNHVPYSCSEGLMAALFETLVQNEGRSISPLYDSLEPVGNTFMPRTLLLAKTADMFDSQVDSSALSDALDILIKDGFCCCDKNEFIYCNDTFQAEHGIAEEIVRLLSAQVPKREYKLDIYGLENQKAMRLAPEQRNAVKVALRNSVTLLIGGPGTGKSATRFCVK